MKWLRNNQLSHNLHNPKISLTIRNLTRCEDQVEYSVCDIKKGEKKTVFPEKSVTESRSVSTLRQLGAIQFLHSRRLDRPEKVSWNQPRHHKLEEFQKTGLWITGFFSKNSPTIKRTSAVALLSTFTKISIAVKIFFYTLRIRTNSALCLNFHFGDTCK